MRQVLLYDTTLRDGMQGQGMSLSAQEKVRVVRKLDELGIHFIEAGFPGSNPKELELFEMLAEVELDQAAGLRLRHDPAARHRGRRGRGAAAARHRLRPGGHPGRQDLGPSPREGHQGEPRGEPGDDPRLGRLPDRRRQAGDLRRRALLRRLPRRRRLRARVPAAPRPRRAPRTSRSATPTAPACRPRSPRRPRPSSTRSTSRSESTPTTTWSARVANSLAAVEEGASLVQGTINGIGERTGNANLTSILPGPAAQAGLPLRHRRAARPAHRDRALRRRAAQHHARPRPALRRPQRLRPQGRHARGRRQRRRPHLRAHGSGGGRQRARDGRLRALGQGDGPSRAERSGIPLDDEQAAKALRTLKEREHRGYHYEAADASFELLLRREAERLRAAVQAGGLPGARSRSARTARSSPRRRSRSGSTASATCAPPRATARSTRSTRRCAGRSPTAIRTSPTSS